MFFQNKRALKLWQNGDAPTKETKKNFVRQPWAARATQHLKVVTKLSEKKWQEIYEATQEVVSSVDNDFGPAEDGENSDNDDPSELVQSQRQRTSGIMVVVGAVRLSNSGCVSLLRHCSIPPIDRVCSASFLLQSSTRVTVFLIASRFLYLIISFEN